METVNIEHAIINELKVMREIEKNTLYDIRKLLRNVHYIASVPTDAIETLNREVLRLEYAVKVLDESIERIKMVCENY